MWFYQNAAGTEIHQGPPTDARGLSLRADCGYTHVNMGSGWLQIHVAVAKLKLAEDCARVIA